MATTRRKARVARVTDLSPSVRSLALAPVDGPVGFEPGQWVDLEVKTPEGTWKRAYSLASAPSSAELEIAVTLVIDGRLSPVLHRLEPGHEVTVDGPQGFFTQDAALRRQPALFVATGTGLAPFRSMLLSRAKSGEAAGAPVTLLFGCRAEEDILWRPELEALAESGQIRLEVSLSRPTGAWRGRTGYVQAHVAELARELAEPHVFICGLNKMVSEVRAVCKQQLAYPRTRVHSERYD